MTKQAVQFYDEARAAQAGCPGPAMSVIVEPLAVPHAELVAKYPEEGLAFLDVDLVRQQENPNGLQLWPTDEEPAHALVFRLDGGKDLSGSAKRQLSEYLTDNWLSVPPTF